MAAKHRIELGNLNANNGGIFSVIAPSVENPAEVVQAAIERGGDMSKYAYFGEVPVGVVVAEQKQENGEDFIVITHLNVLNAYSLHFNVEESLLQHVLEAVPKRHVKRCYFPTIDNKLEEAGILTSLGFFSSTDGESRETFGTPFVYST